MDAAVDETHTARLTLFGTRASFESYFGLRLGYGGSLANGRWDVWYELANHHLDGFSDNRDDLLQHQLRASHDTQIGDGWDLSLTADATAWDEEGALAIGIYLQRRF